MSRLSGAFTIEATTAHGKVLRQRTLQAPDCTHCGGSTNYVTTFGDGALVDYSLRVSGRLVPAAAASGYLYIASHIGIMTEYPDMREGNLTEGGCSVSKGTGQLCKPPFCSTPMCSMGKEGFSPSSLHSHSAAIQGFLMKVTWNSSTTGAEWVVRAGTGGKCLRDVCPMKTVATGALPRLALGDWVALELSAQRSAGASGTTKLSASIDGKQLGRWSVPRVAGARGAVAIGNGMAMPVSEWDNLTIAAAV
jgi:hypothetical protein